MESEKLEDLLLLSLSASKGQRERSEVLDVGVTRDKNLREGVRPHPSAKEAAKYS